MNMFVCARDERRRVGLGLANAEMLQEKKGLPGIR